MNPPDSKPPILPYADPEVGAPRAIARFTDSFKAHLSAAKLESEGLRCTLAESPRVAFGAYSAILSVAADDLPLAVQILLATPAQVDLLVDAQGNRREA